jgi:hypothetical protein
MPEQSAQKPGRIVEIKGVVIDVVFPEGLPEIYTALRIDIPAQDGQEARSIIAEVQQHLGDDRVRAVAMDSTDGLARGLQVEATGGPISVPVGDLTLGHRRSLGRRGCARGHRRGDPPRSAEVTELLAEDRGSRPPVRRPAALHSAGRPAVRRAGPARRC